MAHAGGRPPKYKKQFCQRLIKHMSEGLSFKSFGAEIDVCEETLHEWCRTKPQFSESKKIGRRKQELFYEKFGRSAMAGKIEGFNATAFVWLTKNMLGWRDKQEIVSVNHTTNAEVDLTDIIKNPELIDDVINLEAKFRQLQNKHE